MSVCVCSWLILFWIFFNENYMRKILKIIAVVLFITFVAVQFYRPSQINPPIVAAETLEATTEIPETVAAILKRSCSDCHSNETVYPWYSNISPFSWLLAEHIEVPDSETDDSWLAFDYIQEFYEETEEQRESIVNKILCEISSEDDEISGERVAMINRILRM